MKKAGEERKGRLGEMEMILTSGSSDNEGKTGPDRSNKTTKYWTENANVD